MARRIAILALARPTFDVAFAQENLERMLARLDQCKCEITGSRELLFDADATRHALGEILAQKPDMVLVLQVTFTDASMLVEIAGQFNGDIGIWSIPEPRAGGRLRLNSFCGLNLGSHALGLRARDFGWLYCAPDAADVAERLDALVNGGLKGVQPPVAKPIADKVAGEKITSRLSGQTIGLIGEHPAGFDTCAYDADRLSALAGIEVKKFALPALFDQARQMLPEDVTVLRDRVSDVVDALDTVDQGQLDKSLALKLALDEFRKSGRIDAFAIRCWPETFTEYGGAVCGPVSMLGEARTPCACEADVYGAFTQMLLQAVADAPVFLTDLVDVDADDDSVVVWHCGQAPASMFAGKPSAQIHSNRKMPLLYEFALKPGRVTFARVSQAGGKQCLAIATGEMLERPKSFTGTSGVVRFDHSAKKFGDWLIGGRLEHHMALAYGDHHQALLDVAASLNLPVLDFKAFA